MLCVLVLLVCANLRMLMAAHPHILIGVSGSVAAIKTLPLVCELEKELPGASIRIVATAAATRFLTDEDHAGPGIGCRASCFMLPMLHAAVIVLPMYR